MLKNLKKLFSVKNLQKVGQILKKFTKMKHIFQESRTFGRPALLFQ